MTSTRRVSRRAVVVGLAALGAAGCKRPAAVGKDRPLVIVFGPRHAPANPERLREQLASRAGLTLLLKSTATSEDAIDLVQSGEADAALLSLFDFLFCQGVFEVEPLVQVVRGDKVSQASELLVKQGSSLASLADLQGKKVGYVDPFSVTGFLLPAAALAEAKVTVHGEYLQTHDAVLEAVASGRVDAGASYAGHGATVPGLQVLMTSAPIANEPLFVQARLPAEVKAALRDALLAEHGADALAGVADATGFGPASAQTYASALQSLAQAGLHVEDTIKGGWSRANHHRRPAWSLEP